MTPGTLLRDLALFALVCAHAVAAPNITTSSLPGGTVGVAYNQLLMVTGQRNPVTWSLSAGSLPEGLSIGPGNGNNGRISGTPTEFGAFLFTVRVVDANNDSASQLLTLTIVPAPVAITTTTLPSATINVPYTATLEATGGTGTYVWVRTAGALPAGLSLNPNGTISGTPTAGGNSTFTATVTDTVLRTASKSLSINVVVPTLAITTTSPLPNGTVGIPYTQALEATGGSGGYTWRSTGALPSGVNLTTGGIVTGTPTAAGAFSFTATVTDSGSRTANRTFSLTVAPAAPSITTATLAGGQVGQPYSQTLAASGGSGGYTWSVSTGTLPVGLTLSSAGVIAGSPTTAGTSNFGVTVTDSGGRTGTRSFSIVVAAPTLTVTTATLPAGVVGTAYSQTLEASGGSGGNRWSVTAGALPGGLTLAASGAITGTPNTAGTANFTATVTDSGSHTASRPLTIVINPPALTVTTATLPAGVVGTAYSQTLEASGGSGGNRWSVTAGTLPGGLTLAVSGAITGMPTTAGSSTFTVTVTDSGSRTATKQLTIVIDPPALTVTTASLPGGVVGTAYSQTLQASGGSGGNRWSVTQGSLPEGLTLATSGAITGTPTAAGAASFTVTVTDSGSRTATKQLTIAVEPPALTVTTASLPGGVVGTAYSQTLQASGGSGGNRWSVTQGSLPEGLTLGASGAITGTPTTAGTASFTVTVTDSGSRTATKQLTIAIEPPPLTVTTTALPSGVVGTGYSHTLEASGGTGGNRWSVTSGTLPAGLNLAQGGAITGTPTTAGTANFTVTVTDSANHTASRALSIIVDQQLTITTTTLPGGAVGAPYSATLEAGGGTGYRWSLSAGALPAGLTLNAAGAIAGTPTAAGDAEFTVTVTDAANRSASRPMTISIGAALTVTTTSLPNGVVGAPYSQTLEAAGGSGYRWSVSAGALPAGLALSPAGAITGTPTTAAAANFTVSVTDSLERTATRPLTITVDPPTLTVSTATLPNGAVGSPYSQNVEATGGSGGYRWAVSAGSVPAGLSLAAGGAITGTPTTAGASNFTVTVTDSANRTANKALSITVTPPAITVITSTIPSAVAGAQYSFTLSAGGGAGGYSWSLASGSLPTGLALGANGTILGTPTTPGSSNFTVQVKDSANATATKALTLTITPSTLSVTTQTLPSGMQGSAYSQALVATGGTGGYRWSLDAGSLPDGLALDSAGRISGTIRGSSATFTVGVTDIAGAAASRNLSITVIAPLSLPPSDTLPSGVVGTAYNGSIVPAGGQAPYAFSVASGQLPPSLALDARTGALTGNPSQVGSFTFAVQVRDAAGGQIQANYTVTIANTLTVINPPILAAGSVSVAYQVTLTAAGGTAPYSWSATAGALPAGLTFRPDGAIQGTPTSAGKFNFTATVTDAVGGRASKEFTLTIAATLTITTAPQLPQGVPTSPYNTTLAAAGGTPPYVWSIASGSLPGGLRLDPATGSITGIPTAPATATFTVAVADSLDVTAQKAFTLTIAPGVTFTNPATLPAAVAGAPYTFSLTATGGQSPYSWRIADGTLPEGLALNATSGAISGTPAVSGTFNFTVEVADTSGLRATRVHTIVVDLPSVASIRVTGVPETLGPMQQPQVDLVITNPYPVAITGRLNLSFVPATGMPDDPAVQFSSGGRSATFTIAANDTRAVFTGPRLLIQSGTVVGTIRFTVESLRAGSVPLATPTEPIGSAEVPAAAPVVRTVEARRTSGGFELVVVGASTTRELARMTVRFRPPAGATLQTPEVTVELADAARTWFQDAGSAQYGGQFTITLPFSFVGGTSAIESIGVVVANSAGTSQEVSGPY